MKRKILLTGFLLCVTTAITSTLYAAVYEASTLHNAVARREIVLDLFFERWEHIQNMDLYFDWYGKINWAHGFQVNSINQGSGQKEEVDMRLVRTYGSITVNIPDLGGNKGEGMEKRLKYGTGTHQSLEETEEKKRSDGGGFTPKKIILGFTATGFHYGLTREGTISRGSAGNETFTDYKYTQFFDDIFAVSLLYRPYFHIHFGMILNQQFEPRDDGTMSYSDPNERSMRYFAAFNLLSFLNLNATTRKDEIEAIAVGIIVNELVGFSKTQQERSLPQLSITYKRLNLFNDELYDPVWVESAFRSNGLPKSSDMPDSEKNDAMLHTLSLGLKGFWGTHFYVDLFVEAQKPSKDLVSRITQNKINYPIWRDLRALAGWNIFISSLKEGHFLVVALGMSRYWDPAIPIHRDSGTGYHVYGGIFQMKGRVSLGSIRLEMELGVSHNYSHELRRMTETVDKWVLEGGLTVSF